VVPVGRTAAEWLGRYLSEARPRYGKRPEETAVFLSLFRRRMSPELVGLILAKAVRSSGITRRVTIHSLRASCASHMLWEGANMREIAEFLGHGSITTTARYCAPSREWRRGPGSCKREALASEIPKR